MNKINEISHLINAILLYSKKLEIKCKYKVQKNPYNFVFTFINKDNMRFQHLLSVTELMYLKNLFPVYEIVCEKIQDLWFLES